jgi:hypothetical protein
MMEEDYRAVEDFVSQVSCGDCHDGAEFQYQATAIPGEEVDFQLSSAVATPGIVNLISTGPDSATLDDSGLYLVRQSASSTGFGDAGDPDGWDHWLSRISRVDNLGDPVASSDRISPHISGLADRQTTTTVPPFIESTIIPGNLLLKYTLFTNLWPSNTYDITEEVTLSVGITRLTSSDACDLTLTVPSGGGEA